MPDDNSEAFVPDIQVNDDTGYDISTMAEITRQNQEEGTNDDPEQNLQDSTGGSDSDDPSDLEGDAGNEENAETAKENDIEDDGFDDEHKPEKPSDKDLITLKNGEKEVKVPKDAEVEIKINGKMEKMSLQEALNNASGQIHVSREIQRVQKREKDFENQKATFDERVQKVNANAQALLEIKDPYELCEYICDLKGGDPDELFNEMLRTTAKYAQEYSKMSEREIQLERENRKYKRMQRQKEAETKVQQETTERTAREQNLKAQLEEESFTVDDYLSTIDEIIEKRKKGEEVGYGIDENENPTEDDIIDYMIQRDLDVRVTEGITNVQEGMLEDEKFVERIKKAVLGTELLHGKMSQAEVTKFVEAALDTDNKALSESLREKAKKAKSQKVNSQGQEDEDEGPGSLEELFEGLGSLKF